MKAPVMDVALLAIIAEHRPDLLDHDDIRLLGSTIAKTITSDGMPMATLPAIGDKPKRRRRRKLATGNGVKGRKIGRRTRRPRGTYAGNEAAAD